MSGNLLYKLLLTLLLLTATNIQLSAQSDDYTWGAGKDKILSTKGNPHSKTANSITYHDRVSGLKTRIIYTFNGNGLHTVTKEFYGFKKSDNRSEEFKKFTYDKDDELEEVISNYIKINEMLTNKLGKPSHKSIPLTLEERCKKLEHTFDAYPTPSISNDEVDLVDQIDVSNSNSKRLKEGKIKYSTTWSDSTSLIVHLLYNKQETRPPGYGNLHHKIIYSQKEQSQSSKISGNSKSSSDKL